MNKRNINRTKTMYETQNHRKKNPNISFKSIKINYHQKEKNSTFFLQFDFRIERK